MEGFSPNMGDIIDQLDQCGSILLNESNIEVQNWDYVVEGKNVEAISFHPQVDSPLPSVVLIPGFDVTARDYIGVGIRYASEGFACVAISQRGFGRSEGDRDYVGPQTIHALIQGYRQFQKEPYVDADRMSLFGYSRGAMAASLLSVKIEDLKAAVWAAGIYDFQRYYEGTKPVIRQAMMRETGMTDEAIRLRSSLHFIHELFCPVLILHGEKDENVPVDQAHVLQEELIRLNKEFEIQLFPNYAHKIDNEDRYTFSIDFLKRKLSA